MERADHAETKRLHAEQIASLEQAGRKAVEDARTEEQRRYTALQEIAHETQAQLDQARTDAAGAADAGERLRKRVAQLTAGCRAATGHPGTSGSSPAADTTADLLADVFSEVERTGREMAAEADRRRIAGGACEKAYDALFH